MGIFDKNSSAGLREKYNHAIQTAKSLRMQGGAEERDGKLYFNGTVNSVEEKNQIWNALKTVSDWEKDVVADIKVNAPAARPAPTSASGGVAPATVTYTVQPGDTLSGIAKKFLGNANEYMDIFNANRDQLTDPDMIKPGQVLKIPQPTHR
ncbi:MAG TPA: LysM peptidoglycan-binding domain-containing protein [Vicinamibacterales bacterium]|nr:LysM peptidoglycan-binding domain-containing protein [Vicinamibacterales bacterium]